MEKKYIYIGIFLLSFTLYYLFTHKKRKRKNEIRKKIIADAESDYAKTAKNIAFSISKSKSMYKSLISEVHPDRFQDDRKIQAEELSRRLTKSKKNYNELISLKNEIEDFLNK